MWENFLASSGLFQATFLSYAGAGVTFGAGVATRRYESLRRLGLAILALGWALNAAWIGHRWIEADRAPFKTLYESLLFFAWCAVAVTFAIEALHRIHALAPFSAVAALSALAYALVNRDVEIVNLPPALRSAWFVPHVVVYFVAYAALFASAVAGGIDLFLPPLRRALGRAGHDVDALVYRFVAFGYATLTLGLILGAMWAKFAWGRYWSWDSKENWALVTWLVYLTYLHLRFVRGWHGRRASWLAVGGFGVVLFTYLGMHLLPGSQGSLHVYQ